MKSFELRKLSQDAMREELKSLFKMQFGLRMQAATQQLANTAQLKLVRRNIARVKTVLNQEKMKAGRCE